MGGPLDKRQDSTEDTRPSNGKALLNWQEILGQSSTGQGGNRVVRDAAVAAARLNDYSQVAEDLTLSTGRHERSRVGSSDERTTVELATGDTFWDLSGRKYNGRHPVDAIYEANGLTPVVVERGGKKELFIPTYKAGGRYVLPAESELPDLSRRFWMRLNLIKEHVAEAEAGANGPAQRPGRPAKDATGAADKGRYDGAQRDRDLARDSHDRSRVGKPDERTAVKLRWGDTFWELAGRKYNGRHPIDAIYEANGLTPTVVHRNGKRELIAPIYYAGKTYILPAESELPELSRRFWLRMDAANKKAVPGDTDDGGKADGPDKSGQHKKGAEDKRPAPPSPPGKDDNANGGGGNGPDKSGGKPGRAAPPGPDLMAEALRIEAAHKALATKFHEERQGQGGIGRIWDGIKNNAGSSAKGHSWYDPRALWAHLVERDRGSGAVAAGLQEEAEKIEQLKRAAKASDLASFGAVYMDLTGHAFTPGQLQAVALPAFDAVAAYRISQAGGVDTITDISAALASGAAMMAPQVRTARSILLAMGVGAGVGSITKAGLKDLDGRYANARRDLVIGAVWGGTLPLAELAGARASLAVGRRYGLTVSGEFLAARLETQGAGMGLRLLSAASKSGTAGAVFGALENPVRTALNAADEGRAVDALDLFKRSLEGGVLGFVGGTVLGLTFDGLADGFRRMRPKQVVPPEPKEINGVFVPASGAVPLEDAAKILGKEPADLAARAASEPYAAVRDAVELYEKTGINVQKFDPLTGAPVVPPKFAEALGTVQTVDAMTPDAGLALVQKAQVVASADKFIASNRAAVDTSLGRVTSDTSFQEVMRLKTGADGAEKAAAFAQGFKQSFERDVKIRMSVERVNHPQTVEPAALDKALSQTQADYLQKAADFFKDMTDPAQRARLNTLVDEIFEKFTPRPIAREELADILSAFSDPDRKLAVALVEHGAGNASDVAVRARMQALKEALYAHGGGYIDNVYSLSPDSSGNLIGYLFRKSNSMSMAIRNLDQLYGQPTPHSLVLFDDLAATWLSQAQKELLSKIPKVYVADLGGFEKGLSVVDFAMGAQHVRDKLTGLVEQARSIRDANPHLSPKAVAQKLLDGAAEEAAAAIGPNVVLVRPKGKPHLPALASLSEPAALPSSSELPAVASPGALPAAASDPVDKLYRQIVVPKASKEEIANFLSGFAGEERELAARMLKDGAVHNSFPAMVAKARSVYDQIARVLAGSGKSPQQLLMVVDKDPGGSTHLVTYMIGKVNGLAGSNFISSKQLNELINSGGARGKVVAYLDDTVYSGAQTSSLLQSNISAFNGFDRVVVGSLGAYEKGINAIKGTHLGNIGKVLVATAEIHQPFYSVKHPFFSTLSASAQAKVKQIGGSGGFGDVQGSLIWSYMYPDNNLEFFGHKFAGAVLRLPGP